MEQYCELIAALKVRTSNKKGRHLSTGEAILAGELQALQMLYVRARNPTLRESTRVGRSRFALASIESYKTQTAVWTFREGNDPLTASSSQGKGEPEISV
jgi:hypothetical protein